MFPTQPTQFVDNKTSDSSGNSSFMELIKSTEWFTDADFKTPEQIEHEKKLKEQREKDRITTEEALRMHYFIPDEEWIPIDYENATEEEKVILDNFSRMADSAMLHGNNK